MEVASVTDDVTARAYNSLWRLRADAWSLLEEATERLADGGAGARPKAAARVSELRKELVPHTVPF